MDGKAQKTTIVVSLRETGMRREQANF